MLARRALRLCRPLRLALQQLSCGRPARSASPSTARSPMAVPRRRVARALAAARQGSTTISRRDNRFLVLLDRARQPVRGSIPLTCCTRAVCVGRPGAGAMRRVFRLFAHAEKLPTRRPSTTSDTCDDSTWGAAAPLALGPGRRRAGLDLRPHRLADRAGLRPLRHGVAKSRRVRRPVACAGVTAGRGRLAYRTITATQLVVLGARPGREHHAARPSGSCDEAAERLVAIVERHEGGRTSSRRDSAPRAGRRTIVAVRPPDSQASTPIRPGAVRAGGRHSPHPDPVRSARAATGP